jgi:hypothetical protein
MFQQMQQQGQPENVPPQEPIDNTVEVDNTQESPTPELDAQTSKFSAINR